MHPKPKYTQHFPWLQIFHPKPSESIAHPNYHYFSHDIQGYQKVNLSIHRSNKSKKHLKMYYEIDTQVPEPLENADNSSIRDFDYLEFKEPQPEAIIISGENLSKDSQWVKKYEPHKFIDLLTDEKSNRQLLSWLKSWDSTVFHKDHHNKFQTIPSFISPKKGYKYNSYKSNKNQSALTRDKLILLAGPPGCGKTTLVRVLAHHCKYDIKEINASDDRSASHLIDQIENFSTCETIKQGNKPALICLDEIDGITENEANGIKTILDYLETGNKKKKEKNEETKETKENKKRKYQTDKTQSLQSFKHNRPVIFICNDPFAKSLKELRKRAHVFYFNTLTTERVIKRLKEIGEKEKTYIESEVLQKICHICRNDIRSCVGLLELICKEKQNSKRSPKQIVTRMKVSFVKDNEANLNEFMSSILFKSKQNEEKKIKQISTEIMEIGNPSLLLESMLQNMLYNKQIYHNFRTVLELYNGLIYSDFLLKNGFKYRNQLDVFHHFPYTYYFMTYKNQDGKRIQFPLTFFQKLKKHNTSKDILTAIFAQLPLHIKIHLRKSSLIGPYTLALFLSMQAGSTKQHEVIKAVSRMVTYGFTVKKDQSAIFSPQIDTLLTYGKTKPEILLSSVTKTLMEDNYTFIKMRKDLVGTADAKDTTEMLINQMNLQSRKKRKNKMGIQFKYQEGTGTKITYPLTLRHFV